MFSESFALFEKIDGPLGVLISGPFPCDFLALLLPWPLGTGSFFFFKFFFVFSLMMLHSSDQVATGVLMSFINSHLTAMGTSGARSSPPDSLADCSPLSHALFTYFCVSTMVFALFRKL